MIVGVSVVEANLLAYTLSSQTSNLPHNYLGFLIDANITNGTNWKPLIDKFTEGLTSSKARPLSYGGRLTLPYKFGSQAFGTYFLPFVKLGPFLNGL